MMTGDLVGLRTANEQLGIGRWSTQLERLAADGAISLVRIKKEGGRTYTYIRESDLAKVVSEGLVRPTRHPVGGATPTSQDPLLEALAALETSLKAVRGALKDHDKQVRRDTIVNIAESLHEGVK